ncbi:MAG: DUF2087 domain-containing protein [Candidatus Eisenbacteria bacterium]|nr:DUF2087 domain-containing protein [Candidatus Eisenbacteria bacterium]
MGPTIPFDRAAVPRELRPFLDEQGRVVRWPARQKTQRLVVRLLAGRFEPGRDYLEKDVNFVLMDAHDFGDWAMLRRMLVDWGYLAREGGGARYWLKPESEWPAS